MLFGRNSRSVSHGNNEHLILDEWPRRSCSACSIGPWKLPVDGEKFSCNHAVCFSHTTMDSPSTMDNSGEHTHLLQRLLQAIADGDAAEAQACAALLAALRARFDHLFSQLLSCRAPSLEPGLQRCSSLEPGAEPWQQQPVEAATAIAPSPHAQGALPPGLGASPFRLEEPQSAVSASPSSSTLAPEESQRPQFCAIEAKIFRMTQPEVGRPRCKELLSV